MSDEQDRLVAEIPSDLKALVDADSRTNKEVVEAALWAEFGGERVSALDRRIDEKERRISMIESEKNEREREIEQEMQELQALQTKRERVKQSREDTFEDALEQFSLKHIRSLDEPLLDGSDEQLERWADKLDTTTEELEERLYAQLMEEYND